MKADPLKYVALPPGKGWRSRKCQKYKDTRDDIRRHWTIDEVPKIRYSKVRLQNCRGNFADPVDNLICSVQSDLLPTTWGRYMAGFDRDSVLRSPEIYFPRKGSNRKKL